MRVGSQLELDEQEKIYNIFMMEKTTVVGAVRLTAHFPHCPKDRTQRYLVKATRSPVSGPHYLMLFVLVIGSFTCPLVRTGEETSCCCMI